MSWAVCWSYGAVSDLKFQFPDYFFKTLLIMPSFWQRSKVTDFHSHHGEAFGADHHPPPPAHDSPHQLDHRGGRSNTFSAPCPSPQALLGSEIYSLLNAEWCLEVLLQQLLCISMPTTTLLSSLFFFFFILGTCGAGSLCSLRISRAQWLSRVLLSAFSGRHGCVNCASIWPVVRVLNSYLHSLSPF